MTPSMKDYYPSSLVGNKNVREVYRKMPKNVGKNLGKRMKKMARFAKRSFAKRMGQFGFHMPSHYDYKQLVQIPAANITANGGGQVTSTGDTTRLTENGAAVSSQLYSIIFTLADIAQATTFTALYDQFRIVRIELRLYATNDYTGFGSQTAATSLTEPTGRVFILVDYDDNALPANIAAMREYQNCKEYTTNNKRIIKTSFTPHCANALYGGAFTQYGNVKAPWIDCASSTTYHYGVKIGVPFIALGSANGAFDVEATYFVQFKNVR